MGFLTLLKDIVPFSVEKTRTFVTQSSASSASSLSSTAIEGTKSPGDNSSPESASRVDYRSRSRKGRLSDQNQTLAFPNYVATLLIESSWIVTSFCTSPFGPRVTIGHPCLCNLILFIHPLLLR